MIASLVCGERLKRNAILMSRAENGIALEAPFFSCRRVLLVRVPAETAEPLTSSASCTSYTLRPGGTRSLSAVAVAARRVGTLPRAS